MPSLNLKTRKLRYSAADIHAIESCELLIDTIIEYDAAAKSDAEIAKGALGSLKNHLRRQRGEAIDAKKPPKIVA